MSTPTEQVTVTVASVNGISFTDTSGTRWTISKFARPQPALPRVGATVVVTTPADGKHFVTSLTDVTPAPPVPPATAPATVLPDRERLIVRQNALGHAVAILCHNAGEGEKVKLDDVLRCAERIEEWVTR